MQQSPLAYPALCLPDPPALFPTLWDPGSSGRPFLPAAWGLSLGSKPEQPQGSRPLFCIVQGVFLSLSEVQTLEKRCLIYFVQHSGFLFFRCLNRESN